MNIFFQMRHLRPPAVWSVTWSLTEVITPLSLQSTESGRSSNVRPTLRSTLDIDPVKKFSKLLQQGIDHFLLFSSLYRWAGRSWQSSTGICCDELLSDQEHHEPVFQWQHSLNLVKSANLVTPMVHEWPSELCLVILLRLSWNTSKRASSSARLVYVLLAWILNASNWARGLAEATATRSRRLSNIFWDINATGLKTWDKLNL